MDSRENSEREVSDKPVPKRVDFLTALAEDGFDVGEMEKNLSDKWISVEYSIKDPAKLGIKAKDGSTVQVCFMAKRGLDAEKDKEHTLIQEVRFITSDVRAKLPPIKRVKQADLGPIRKDEVMPHPFRKYPRNMQCFCGSGKKFKKCHLDQVPQMIMKNQAPQVQHLFDQYMKAFGDNPDKIEEVQKELEH